MSSDDRYPDKCPECGCPAWIGPLQIHCSGEFCKHYERPPAVSTEELKEVVDKGLWPPGYGLHSDGVDLVIPECIERFGANHERYGPAEGIDSLGSVHVEKDQITVSGFAFNEKGLSPVGLNALRWALYRLEDVLIDGLIDEYERKRKKPALRLAGTTWAESTMGSP